MKSKTVKNFIKKFKSSNSSATNFNNKNFKNIQKNINKNDSDNEIELSNEDFLILNEFGKSANFLNEFDLNKIEANHSNKLTTLKRLPIKSEIGELIGFLFLIMLFLICFY